MEQIGLEAILKDTSFTKGLANMMRGMAKAEKQTKRTAGVWSKSFSRMGKGVTGFVGKSVKLLAYGGASLVGALGLVGAGIGKLAIDAAGLPERAGGRFKPGTSEQNDAGQPCQYYLSCGQDGKSRACCSNSRHRR